MEVWRGHVTPHDVGSSVEMSESPAGRDKLVPSRPSAGQT